MTVGLPGTGIGGLFYLVSALAMPIVQVLRHARGKRQTGSWRVALSQFSLAFAMFSILAGTGLLIDHALAFSQGVLENYLPAVFGEKQGFTLGVIPTFITLAVLGSALIVIEIAGAILIWVDSDDGPSSMQQTHLTS